MLENIVKGKRLDNNEWIIGYYWEGGQKSFIIEHNESAMLNEATGELLVRVHQVDSRTVCRCTGKPDKCDRILFENDVVKFEREGEEPVLHTTVLTSSAIGLSNSEGDKQIVAEVCGLMFQSGDQMLLPGIDSEGIPDYRKMEVIGNVFDDTVVMKTSVEDAVVSSSEVETECECKDCMCSNESCENMKEESEECYEK